jgi:multisubunit Na+/H+ antiporter MnhB subunit
MALATSVLAGWAVMRRLGCGCITPALLFMLGFGAALLFVGLNHPAVGVR